MSHVFYRAPGKTYPKAVRAEGGWIWDAEGNRYLDGSGGTCVVTIEHGVPEIALLSLLWPAAHRGRAPVFSTFRTNPRWSPEKRVGKGFLDRPVLEAYK